MGSARLLQFTVRVGTSPVTAAHNGNQGLSKAYYKLASQHQKQQRKNNSTSGSHHSVPVSPANANGHPQIGMKMNVNKMKNVKPKKLNSLSTVNTSGSGPVLASLNVNVVGNNVKLSSTKMHFSALSLSINFHYRDYKTFATHAPSVGLGDALNTGQKEEEKQAQVETKVYKYNGPIDKMLRKLKWAPDDLVRDEKFNRWMLIPAATGTHLCIGSVYAWSVFSQPLMSAKGVMAPAATDWLLSDITITFSLIMGGMAWGAVFSSYLDRFGPRFCVTLGGLCLFTGFNLASLAIEMHSLPVLYLGGLVWGMANGWSYVPPVTAMLKWFPERKGFAGGVCIVGFGGGAIIAAPLFQQLIHYFKYPAEYIGPKKNVDLITEGGRIFATVGDDLKEVVVASDKDIIRAGFEGIADAGVYLVGTGSTGVAESLSVLGAVYGLTMAACAAAFRLPKRNYLPPGLEHVKAKNPKDDPAHVLTEFNIARDVAIWTPQFWILYASFGCGITGAYGLLSCGKIILTEAFGHLPLVTNSFTTTFVAAMSFLNLSGRLAYSQLSDVMAKSSAQDPFYARKKAFNIMFTVAAPSYALIALSTHLVGQGGELIPLALFTASTFAIISSFGGITGTRPAVIGDLFGLKDAAALQAIQLSVVLPAAFLGPKIVTTFRENSVRSSIEDLATKVDNHTFLEHFGASKDHLAELIDKKTVTIHNLLEILPSGTPDPSCYVYDSAMYVMAAMQLAALCLNLTINPISSALHMKKDHPIEDIIAKARK